MTAAQPDPIAAPTTALEESFRPYFLSDNYLSGQPNQGTLRVDGDERVVVLPEELICGLHRALEYETGHAWPIVAYTCGRKWGQRLLAHWRGEWARHYGVALDDAPFPHFEVWLAEAFAFFGWGRLEVDFSLEQRGVVQCFLEQSVLARLLKDVVEHDHVCEIFTGLFAAVISDLAGVELEALEVACEAGGHRRCHFVVAREAYIERARSARLDGGSPEAILEALLAD